MKVKDILNYNKLFKNIINDKDVDVTALVKFKLLTMCKQFESVVNNFETIREEKVRQYSTPNGGGTIGILNPVKDDYKNDEEFKAAQKVYEEKLKGFTDDITEILESDVSVNMTKFTPEEVMNAGLSADDLLVMYELIQEV